MCPHCTSNDISPNSNARPQDYICHTCGTIFVTLPCGSCYAETTHILDKEDQVYYCSTCGTPYIGG